MLLSFDVGIIYLLHVDKYKHLVNSGPHSNFIRFYYVALLSRLLEINAIKKMLLLYI